MRESSRLVWVLLGGLGLWLAVPSALAGECTVACVRARQACTAAAMQARRACAMECRSARSEGSFIDCFGPCREEWAEARATCKTAFRDCRTSCIPQPGGGGPCAEACGATARSCLDGVKQAAFTCGTTCAADARAAAQACRASANRPQCLRDAAQALAACLRSCVATATDGAQTCRSGLQACLAGCGGGSPGGAFLQ